MIDSNGNTPLHVLIQSLKHIRSNSWVISKNNEISSEHLLNLVELMLNYCEVNNDLFLICTESSLSLITD